MRSYYESENSLGLDGNADIVICRNGWTTFKTKIGKDMITFPVANLSRLRG